MAGGRELIAGIASRPGSRGAAPIGSTGPVFVGGTGRSGTTLFARILGRHANIFTLRYEARFLVAPVGLVRLADGGLRAHEVELFVNRLRKRWYHRVPERPGARQDTAGLSYDITWGEVSRAVEDLMRSASGGSRHPYDVAARFVDDLFMPATRRSGARRWCEKTPRNVLLADKLSRMFPESRFVHVIRDGRDVVSSMLENGFWPLAAGPEFESLSRFSGQVTFEGARDYWIEVLRLARQVAGRVPASRYLEVRMEDLLSSPEASLQRVCSFLGERLGSALLDLDLSQGHVGRFRNDLSRRQIAEFERYGGELLARLGYEGSSDQ
jgi:hypothetical protein